MTLHSVQKQMFKGAAWMVGLKLVVRSIGLVSTLILARLLIPEDFGLIAIAMAFYALLEVLRTFSFDLYLIQNQDATPEHYNTAWTLNVIFGFVVAFSLVLLAPWLSEFYEDERLENIFLVVAIIPVINGFVNIWIVNFRKDMEFHKEFKFELIKKIFSFVITISAAFIYQSYWALLIGMVSSSLIGLALSYIMVSNKPGICLGKILDMFHFSFWVLISNILTFVSNRGTEFIIPKFLGVHSLGVFSISYEISNLPTTEMVHPISRALFPGYSKLKSTAEMRIAYLTSISVISSLAIPVSMGVAALSDLVVLVLLGEQWVDAIPLISLLAVVGVARVLQANSGPVFLSKGIPKVMVLITFVHIIIMFPAMFYFIEIYGLQGVAYSLLLATVISTSLNFGIMIRVLNFKLFVLIKKLAPQIASSAMMYGTLVYFNELYDFESLIIELLFFTIAGALLYIVLLYLMAFFMKEENLVLQFLSKNVKEKFR